MCGDLAEGTLSRAFSGVGEGGCDREPHIIFRITRAEGEKPENRGSESKE